MRAEYDFSKAVRNPYSRHSKKQVTLRLNEDAIAYFKAMAEESGVPCQNLINSCLLDCKESGKKLEMVWKA